MRTLTFNKNFGDFKAGETYDVENNLTADYFVDSNIASEEVLQEDCVSCKSEKAEEVQEDSKKIKKNK